MNWLVGCFLSCEQAPLSNLQIFSFWTYCRCHHQGQGLSSSLEAFSPSTLSRPPSHPPPSVD